MARREARASASVLAIASLFFAGPSLAQVEIPESAYRLNPSVSWTLDFADQSCAARRVFGEEGREVFLELRQFQPSLLMQMTVASDDISRRLRDLETTFVPDTRSDDEHGGAMQLETNLFGDGFVTQVTLLSSSQLDMLEQAGGNPDIPTFDEAAMDRREAEIQGLLIEDGFRRPVFLATGSMHPIMEVMRECLDGLVEHWGLDSEAHRSLTRPATPRDMQIWAQEISERYPRDQLRAGEQALVNIRLIVSEEGRATECAIQSSMNEIEFDELACELLLENARFEPALDANSAPIRSYWTTTVVYRIG